MSRSMVACLGAIIALAFSCSRDPSAGLSLPADSPFASGLGWGIVRESYARLKAEPDPAAADLGQLRDGTLVEILGREYPTGAAPAPTGSSGTKARNQAWYRVRPVAAPAAGAPAAASEAVPAPLAEGELAGWLGPDSIERFDRRAQALRRLAELKR